MDRGTSPSLTRITAAGAVLLAVLLGTGGPWPSALAQPGPPGRWPRDRYGPPPPPPPRDPADAAHLIRMGSVDVRIHDPSGIVRCKDEYWLFATGPGVRSFRSKDLKTWEPGPRVFANEPPKWVLDEVPANRNGNDFWAPDVIQLGGRYLLYYSVSSWGKNTSVIGLATNRTLDPADPEYKWVDERVVFRSTAADDFNAIDPAPTLDPEGNLWLAVGSFWGGIRLVQLDAATGRRLAPDSPVHALAYKEQIEGPFIHRRGGRYYLFVAWGWCCRGVRSTYNIRVGRSDRITGPYLDKDGRDMRLGGGTLVLDTDGPFIGPGQPAVYGEGGREWLVCHFYDATRRGRGTLALRPLTWDADGWPVAVE